MKKVITSLASLLLLATISINAQGVADRVVNKLGTEKDFTTVHISPKMFSLMNDIVEGEEDLEFVKYLTGMTVLACERSLPHYFETAMDAIGELDYEELLSVKSLDENVKMYVKEIGGKISDLLILVNSSSEFVLVDVSGLISRDQIAMLAKSMNDGRIKIY